MGQTRCQMVGLLYTTIPIFTRVNHLFFFSPNHASPCRWRDSTVPPWSFISILSCQQVWCYEVFRKNAFIELCRSTKPRIYQQYLASLKTELLCCRLVTLIPRSLLNLTFPAAVFLVLSMSAKYSMVCRLSVNQLTSIHCRPCADISLPLSLPSDDAVKSKSSSDAGGVHHRPALWIPKAERPFAIHHSSSLSATEWLSSI